MKKNTKIITGVLAVLIGVGLFYGGVKYGESNQASTAQTNGQFGRNGQAGNRGGNRNMNGGGFVAGQVLSMDDKSVVIKLASGGSKIAFTSSSTAVSKSVAGSLSDLAVGSKVMVQGSANADGSLTAQSIQIRP